MTHRSSKRERGEEKKGKRRKKGKGGGEEIWRMKKGADKGKR